MLYGLLAPLFSLVKIKRFDISDPVFKLHTKITVIFLVTFSLLLSAEQYFGKPIDCFLTGNNKDFLDNYCWLSGTYIFENLTGVMGNQFVSYGVQGIGENSKKSRIHLKYYQWVVFILLIQSAFFYLPGFIWKLWERGLISKLCGEDCSTPDQWRKHKTNFLEYFKDKYTKHLHKFYAYRYFWCELMNCATIVFNMIFLDVVLLNFWSSYAPAMSSLVSFNLNDWAKHTSLVFPKLSKCDFFSYGPSGSVQTRDVLCLLPLNFLNEKIFAFIYIWFIMLLVISVLNVGLTVTQMFSKRYRIYRLRAVTMFAFDESQMRRITNQANLADYFILRQMARNLDTGMCIDLMDDILAMKRSRRVSFSDE